MFHLFFTAFLLGVVFNAAPGAILAESIRRGLKGGFAPALAIQIGSLVGDALWVVLGLSGAAFLISIPYVQTPLAIIGALLLAYLAYESFKDGRKPLPKLDEVSTANQNKVALLTGASLSISNPLNITYWAALGGTISTLTTENPTTEHFVVFISGFMLSSVIWCFVAAGAIGIMRKRLNTALWKILNYGCGIGLGALSFVVFTGLTP